MVAPITKNMAERAFENCATSVFILSLATRCNDVAMEYVVAATRCWYERRFSEDEHGCSLSAII
jgi:hypothetical protein